jgi:hypothetical protein
MEPDQTVETQILGRYLLGQLLSDDELERIEERYFTDDSYFERLIEAEDELIDRSLRGELQGLERAQFQTHFLSSARRREKWEVQRAIAEFFRSSARPVPFLTGIRRFLQSQSTLMRAGVALAAIVVAFTVGLLGWGYFSLRDKAATLRSRLIAAETRAPTASLRSTFSLAPGLVRSGPGNVLPIGPSGAWVTLRLHLNTPEDPGRAFFVATLTTVEGEEVWRQSRLASTGEIVEVEIPSSAITRGDYVLSLVAVTAGRHTELPSYVFRIE